MGDEDRKKFISSNIVQLTKSTSIGPELVVRLLGKGLINDSDQDLLLDPRTANLRKAIKLYTETASKWDESQFENFKQALQETGNLLALQAFTNAGGGGFLTILQVQLLKQQRDKSDEGTYEGLSLEDEVNANRLVRITKGDGRFSVDGMFVLSAGLDMKEVIHIVSHFEETLKNNVVWWNPRKPPLPKNYIERRVAKTQDFKHDEGDDDDEDEDENDDEDEDEDDDDGEDDGEDEDDDDSEDDINNKTTLIELGVGPSEDVLVLLVDAPGMGKSSEMSNLENKLRVKVPTNRVILRVNLNEAQSALTTLSPSETASSVLLKLAPFIPANILSTVGVRLFVLLDGLDEVCPKHKDTMIDLLRIFTSASEPTLGKNLRVVVTTRPHLREVVQKEFQLKSWSLLPLTEEEQDEYMKSVLGVSDEQLSEFRGTLTRSVKDLLSNPLMLSMFLDVINSEGTFSGGDELNIFELYTRYVYSKHKLQLVEKEGMRAENNFTERHMQLMFQRNLPHYYRVAIKEFIEEDSDSEDSDSKVDGNVDRTQRRIFRECAGSGLVAQDEPSGVTRDELLSIGLLVEGSDNQLVFKHRSFAEFFYARLLTQEESAPQIVRDILFNHIYSQKGIHNVLENVESFLVGASPASFSLSPKWLLLSKNGIDPTKIISEFAVRINLFPHFVLEVLLSFVQGDPNDLCEAHRVLFDDRCRIAFIKLFDWMRENKGWTREELLKISQITTSTPSYPPKVANEVPQATARLMLAIGLHFEGQELLSEEEVGAAVNSCDHRILCVVAQFQKHGSGRSKWEWLEDRLSGGKSQLKKLFLQMDDADWSVVIDDRESACKLVSTLSNEEISALVTNNETRVSDVIGENPLGVGVALGEEFVPLTQLAEFRGKFGAAKGKTVFEMEDGCEFALENFWDDLVGEVRREEASGPVGVALREALGRMGRRSWELLRKLEKEVRLRVGLCRRKRSGEKEEENGAEDLGVKVMDWVTRGLRWSDSLTPLSPRGLPFVLRYYGNVDSTHLSNSLNKSDDVMCDLRSLIVLSFLRSHDNEYSSLFPILTACLREQRPQIRPEWTPLFELIFRATQEQIRATSSRLPNLVSDLSVGGVALNIFTAQNQPTTATNMHGETWEVILSDVIQFMPCCDIPATLQQICRLKDEDNKLEMLLKEVLTSKDVLRGWRKRFHCKYRNEHVNLCAVRNLLSFYFSVFGLNCDWMKLEDGVEVQAYKWYLAECLPVEISNAVRGNPQWTHLLPQFQHLLREYLRENKVTDVTNIAMQFCYETEAEWETLLTLIRGETLLPRIPSFFIPAYLAVSLVTSAAPLIRALIKLYGVEWTKSRVPAKLWNAIPSDGTLTNSEMRVSASTVGSLGSLLHSAIELGELEEVKKRAWPGLVKWKNEGGKSALQVAMEKYEELHPIRLHLDKLN